MGGTFPWHIPPLGVSVLVEGRRLRSRIQGETGELEMICQVMRGQYFVGTDGQRCLNEGGEILSGMN